MITAGIENDVVSQPEKHAAEVDAGRSSRKHIRGSSLLFAGRLLSMLVNFATHTLIVRYLPKAAYGAFAYAQAVVKMGDLTTFGMKRAVNLFVPVQFEKREYDQLFGSLLAVLGLIGTVGCLIPVAVFLLQGALSEHLIHDPLIVSVLAIMVFLIPLEELDDLLVGLFAVFAKPKAIFFRRYVLAPLLKFSVVLALVAFRGDVQFLAAGYLLASVAGVSYYGWTFWRLLQAQGLASHFAWSRADVRWKELLAFALPLYTTDVVFTVMNSLNVYLLGYFHSASEVAAYRAVLPVAALNQVVMMTFAVLYSPQAARLFAREQHSEINHLYWQTAAWIAVLTFPVFLVTFSLAEPLTLLLFGSRYAGSGDILALMSLGYFVNAAAGLNGMTLTIFRKVRLVSAINLATAAASLALNLSLIPRFGGWGAGIATCSTYLLHNLLKQAGLRRATDVRVFDRRYLRIYLAIIGSATALLAAQHFWRPPVGVGVLMAIAFSLLTLRISRRALDVEQTFPELMRIPGLRRLLAASDSDDPEA